MNCVIRTLLRRISLAALCMGCFAGSVAYAWEEAPMQYYIFEQNGLYGYMNEGGEIHINPQFQYANSFYQNTAIVDTGNGKQSVINEAGEIQFSVSEGILSHDGEDFFRIALASDGRLNYHLNAKGDRLYKEKYKQIGVFSEGYAMVILDETIQASNNAKSPIDNASEKEPLPPDTILQQQCSYINRDGKRATNQIYEYASDFKDGYALVKQDGIGKIIDTSFVCVSEAWEGEILTNTETNLGNGLFFVRRGERQDVYDAVTSNNFTETWKCDSVLRQLDGTYYLVLKNGFKGVMDKDGEWEIQPIYDDVSLLIATDDEAFFKAKKNSKWGIIDKSQTKKYPFEVDEIIDFHISDGEINTVAVKDGGKYHVVDKKGKIIGSEYDKIYYFSPDDIYVGKRGSIEECIDAKTGTVRFEFPPGFYESSDGKLIACTRDKTINKLFYVNAEGAVIMPHIAGETAEYKAMLRDVSIEDWYGKAVFDIHDRDIMKGDTKGAFHPNNSITRAEFITTLARYSGDELDKYAKMKMPFEDVDIAWANAAICWGAEKGIIKGKDAAHFNPNEPITRQEIAVIMSNYSTVKDVKTDMLVFHDDSQISAWAKAAVYDVAEQGIMKGDTKGNFKPQSPCTRAETAQIFYNMME